MAHKFAPWSLRDVEEAQNGETSSFLHGGRGLPTRIAANEYGGRAAILEGSSVHGRPYVGYRAGSSLANAADTRGTAAGSLGKSGKPRAVDDDDEETFFERVSNSPLVLRLNAAVDRLFQNYFVAVALDVAGVLLFTFDIYTDALVVDALSRTEHKDWMIATLCFILWHYALMAALVTAYLKRTTTKLNVLGLEEGDAGSGGGGVLPGSGRFRWLWFVPFSLPGVVCLDVAMLFTSILPIMFPRLFVNFSSFLSNYNFSRFFIEFVFESIPQTILQTYIYHRLTQSHLAGSEQQRTVAMSLTVSAINCLKYGWKLYKAADDAGLTLPEYFKYLLLLKGNYECSPSAMIAVINDCCSVRKDTPPASSAATTTNGIGGVSGRAVAATSAASGGARYGGGGGEGGRGDGGTVFVMNGFHLHRNKSQYGPAQQAYILLNAFDRIEGCTDVRRWVISGCPLASINRILEKGVRAFKNLRTLEVNECAVRGDTWPVVSRAIKQHKQLDKVKLIQTGMLPKYRNDRRLRVVSGLFKHGLGLRAVALCVSWWGEEQLQSAVESHLLDHPTLESLAIELPPGAPLAVREPGAAGPRDNNTETSNHPHSGGIRRDRYNSGVNYSSPNGGGGNRKTNVGSGVMMPPLSPLLAAAAVGGAGRDAAAAAASTSTPGYRSRSIHHSTSGVAAGFLSPFATDAPASTAGGPNAAGGGPGGSSAAAAAAAAAVTALPRALLGLVQQSSLVLSEFASYLSGGTVNGLLRTPSILGIAFPGGGGAAAAGADAATGVVSTRYCWLLAAVVTAAPALRSLYIHNHALPEGAAEGVGQLAAALAGNSRLMSLSLRGSRVGDAGAGALARVLGGHNTALTSLNLRGCQLHDEGVAALSGCLVDNRGLKLLDLSYNRVLGGGAGGGCLAGLDRALRLNSTLEELRLEGWRDTFEDPQVSTALASSLATNAGLRLLSLAGCCLSSNAAAALASALLSNTTLTALDLSTTAAADADGAAADAGGAAANGTSGGGGRPGDGRIVDAGVAALGAALGINRHLVCLRLIGSRCGALGGAALQAALAVNNLLRVLDLSGDGGSGVGDSWELGGMLGGVCGRLGQWLEGDEGEEEEAATEAVAGGDVALSGVDDDAAACIFTALQTNNGLRVLRLRGATRLTMRAVRAAGEMLRHNTTLVELDLSNSSFVAAADPLVGRHHDVTNATLTPTSSVGTAAAATAAVHSPPVHRISSFSRVGALAHTAAHPPPRPSSVRLVASSSSIASQPTSPRSTSSKTDPHFASASVRRHGSVGAIGSLDSGTTVTAVGGLAAMGVAGGMASEADLSEDAREVLGAMWSGLAGGLAGNRGLGVLRLAHCGVGAVAAAALAPALMQNSTLQELDLIGLPVAVARTHFASVVAQAAANLATRTATAAIARSSSFPAFTAAAAAGGASTSAGHGSSGTSGGGGDGEGCGCCLVSLKVTGESYGVLDLLGADKVTSRAAEEAAAAAEEAMRAPRRVTSGVESGGDGPNPTGRSRLLALGTESSTTEYGVGRGSSGGSGRGLGLAGGRRWGWWRRT